MFVKEHFALIASTIIASLLFMDTHGAEENDRINILNEYRKVLQDNEFEKMLRIYSNETLSPLEKEKQVVDFFSSLPRRTKSRLPVPIPFRSLTDGAQQKIKAIYYESGIEFEEKLNQIKQLIEDLYLIEQVKKVNDDPDSEYLEFNVNVTLKLNGYYKKHDLKNYLNKDEIQDIEAILSDDTSNHEEKSLKIGELLRQIFRYHQHNSDEWPALMGMEKLPRAMHRAIAHTLFSENPTANMQPLLDFYYKLNSYSNDEVHRPTRARRHVKMDDAIRILKKDEEELIFRDRPKIYTDYEN